jgi:hypothetical protein
MRKLTAIEDVCIFIIQVGKIDTKDWSFYEKHPKVRLDYVPSVYDVAIENDEGEWTNLIPRQYSDGFFSIAEMKEMEAGLRLPFERTEE